MNSIPTLLEVETTPFTRYVLGQMIASGLREGEDEIWTKTY